VEVYVKNIASTYTIGTWNVRSLWQDGKLENVMQEMIRMNIHIGLLGIAETFWNGEGDFNATLPGQMRNLESYTQEERQNGYE